MFYLLFVIIICIICFLLFTDIGKKIKLRISGTAEEMLNEDASSLEGAKAYYNTAINKKEKDYQAANSIYMQMLGKIKNYEEQLRNLQKESMKLSININSCINENNDDNAKIYLKRQQEVDDKIVILKDALKEIRENSVLQKETVDNLFSELEDLKSEKENAVLTIETAQVTESLQVTPGVSSKEEDKMLEKVREGVKKTKERSDGSKIAYDNSSIIQQRRLDKQMKDKEVERKLQELKANKKR